MSPDLDVILMSGTEAQAARLSARRPLAVIVNLRHRTLHRGGAVLRLPSGWGGTPGVNFRYLVALVAARGRTVSRAELAAFLWGDDPNGGPLTAEKAIDRLHHKVSPRLAVIGLAVVRASNLGRCVVDLWAEPLREAA